MKKVLDDVAEFHRACDVPVLDSPQFPPDARIKLRFDLVEEEYLEFCAAMGKRDLVGIADSLADMVYVIAGTALEFGIPLDRVWDEVQRSNMAKVDAATGKVRKRADGKVEKPPGFLGPDIAGILRSN